MPGTNLFQETKTLKPGVAIELITIENDEKRQQQWSKVQKFFMAPTHLEIIGVPEDTDEETRKIVARENVEGFILR